MIEWTRISVQILQRWCWTSSYVAYNLNMNTYCLHVQYPIQRLCILHLKWISERPTANALIDRMNGINVVEFAISVHQANDKTVVISFYSGNCLNETIQFRAFHFHWICLLSLSLSLFLELLNRQNEISRIRIRTIYGLIRFEHNHNGCMYSVFIDNRGKTCADVSHHASSTTRFLAIAIGLSVFQSLCWSNIGWMKAIRQKNGQLDTVESLILLSTGICFNSNSF